MNSPPTLLHHLAMRAGMMVDWENAAGEMRRVSDDTLHTLLESLGFACATTAQCRDSIAYLDDLDNVRQMPSLLVATCGEPVPLPWLTAPHRTPYRLRLDNGEVCDGELLVSSQSRHACIPAIRTPGYHQLEIDDEVVTIAAAPARCCMPADVTGQPDAKAWGLSVQLYALRRAQDGGVGDFTTLTALAEAAARQGASALAISPVHAMFAARPAQYSPYAPSNRACLNWWHVDPAECFGRRCVEHAIDTLGLRAGWLRRERGGLIDWPRATHAKLRLLRHLFTYHGGLNAKQRIALQAFRDAGGRRIEAHARFEMLCALQARCGSNWHDWPQALRDPDSAQVAALAHQHSAEVDFHVFLQWLAHTGLTHAQRTALDAGMPFGLIADLAIGTDPGGSECWQRHSQMLCGVSVGAPPDLFNTAGQSWGLTTFSPWGLRKNGYGAFIDVLRAVLTYAGGMRIDHVPGLDRLWVVPHGAAACDGAYLRYPLADLLRLVALESWRHRAIIVGEDLGTIANDLRARLRTAGVLGTDVLWFARQGNEFIPPSCWRQNAVATTTTHDLPTLAGWWEGRDITWRNRLTSSSNHARTAFEARAQERHLLWKALQTERLAPSRQPPARAPLEAVAAFVGRTPAPLVLLPLEDLSGMKEQPNLPGTTTDHPNWRRRLRMPPARLLGDERAMAALRALAKARREVTPP